MGTAWSAGKTLIVPALISLVIYLVSTYLLIPFWRQYRNRYSQYLPLETISNQTSSLRARITGAVSRYIARRRGVQERLVIAEHESDGGFDSDDGEELGDVNESARSVLNRGNYDIDTTRRLSRDLEEGFRDDSDEETEDRGTRR